MPVLKPFKAVHYNLKKVKDLKKVVSPLFEGLLITGEVGALFTGAESGLLGSVLLRNSM